MLDDDTRVTISHPDTPRRPFWEGTFKNAKEYIEQHYPRHSHDGNGGQIMSAQINLPDDGGVSTFHDGVWTHPEDKTELVEESTPYVAPEQLGTSTGVVNPTSVVNPFPPLNVS